MAFPRPVPGLVLRYSFLWHSEYLRGREEGVKDRPCAVVMMVTGPDGKPMVTVLPVTHTPPTDASSAIEIPYDTKKRLGLDDERSWVVIAEANQFAWPGPDLRMAENGKPDSVVYGQLPRTFYNTVRDRFDAAISARLARVVPRTE